MACRKLRKYRKFNNRRRPAQKWCCIAHAVEPVRLVDQAVWDTGVVIDALWKQGFQRYGDNFPFIKNPAAVDQMTKIGRLLNHMSKLQEQRYRICRQHGLNDAVLVP